LLEGQSDEENIMRHIALLTAGVILLGANGTAGAFPASGQLRTEGNSPVLLVQDKEKSEPLKKKVKRAWRNLTGYKFDVACPGFWLSLNQSTCTQTGKNRDDARGKCQSAHPFCQLRDANLLQSRPPVARASSGSDAMAMGNRNR
jgi:hypothetical protein